MLISKWRLYWGSAVATILNESPTYNAFFFTDEIFWNAPPVDYEHVQKCIASDYFDILFPDIGKLLKIYVRDRLAYCVPICRR